jgi:hypothetical protein
MMTISHIVRMVWKDGVTEASYPWRTTPLFTGCEIEEITLYK